MTRTRAEALPRDERRLRIIAATVPLLRQHGREVTTRQIAEAAGIAEGTIFRAFAGKDELLDAALEVAFDPTGFLADVEAIDPGLPAEEKLLALTRLMQARFMDIFGLMATMGLSRPAHRPEGTHEHLEWRRRSSESMIAIFEPDAARFRMPVSDVLATLRLLTFSASHPHISDQRPLRPEQIVDRVLHGVLGDPHHCDRPSDPEEDPC